MNSAAQYENAASPPTCFFIASNVFPSPPTLITTSNAHASQRWSLLVFTCTMRDRFLTILESAENERETKTAPLAIKDIVHSEIKIESLFTHLHVFPNLLHTRETMGSKQH